MPPEPAGPSRGRAERRGRSRGPFSPGVPPAPPKEPEPRGPAPPGPPPHVTLSGSRRPPQSLVGSVIRPICAPAGGAPAPGGSGPGPPEGPGRRLTGRWAGSGRAGSLPVAAVAHGAAHGELQLPACPAAPRLALPRAARCLLACPGCVVTNPCGNGVGRLAGAPVAAANGRRGDRRCGL